VKTPHTAKFTVKFLDEMLGNGKWIRPAEWPSKSPDLNPMDYAIWGILQGHVVKKRRNITTLDGLKEVLLAAWADISPEVVRDSCRSWKGRLAKCHEVKGGHFEFRL